ncbi:MAG: hypothetical protein GXY83_11445 [Rhodopirellula sp.]|nr:hypothetical protein [Rhodopirellula sp.]
MKAVALPGGNALSMLLLLITLLLIRGVSAAPKTEAIPYRWVFVSPDLRQRDEAEQVAQVARTASQHGFNGMVLSARFDTIEVCPPRYFENLQFVKQVCEEQQLEIIPLLCSIGYGSAHLRKDFAAGLPVCDARFIVDSDEAKFASDTPVGVVNGSFEVFAGNRVQRCKLQDKPGSVSFIDPQGVKDGRVSLRFENFGRNQGHGRVMFEVPVRPFRCYVASCWVKSQALQSADSSSRSMVRAER